MQYFNIKIQSSYKKLINEDPFSIIGHYSSGPNTESITNNIWSINIIYPCE